MKLANRVHHFAVAVSDLESSVAWYCDKLDFVVDKRFTIPEAALRIVKLASPSGFQIELLMREDESGRARREDDLVAPGSKHLCFEVESIEEAVSEIRRRGITLTQEPKIFEATREKNCWIKDNEGNPIEFIEEW